MFALQCVVSSHSQQHALQTVDNQLRYECEVCTYFAQHNLASCLPFVSFMLFGFCTDLNAYFMHIPLSHSYTDNASATSLV